MATQPDAPTDSEPAVDSADSPEPTADADELEAATADSVDEQPTDDLKGARAARDAAKRKCRDAEARADALAARVAELEQAGEQHTKLQTDFSKLRDSLVVRVRETVEEQIRNVVPPELQPVALSLVEQHVAAVDAADPAAAKLAFESLQARFGQDFAAKKRAASLPRMPRIAGIVNGQSLVEGVGPASSPI